MRRTVALIVLDGWGVGEESESNPIYTSKPERFEWMGKHFPLTSLQASGISVGLPWGEVGNSEVGHLTLGAGKVIYQYFPKITMAIRDGSFFENEALRSAFAHAKQNGGAVNFVGLLTKASVHASLDHLLALIEMARREGVDRVKLQLFTDGKDSGPGTAHELLRRLPTERLGSLVGRYYAMNRNENWQVTARAYECLVGTSAQATEAPEQALRTALAKGTSEEFLPPMRFGAGPIEDGDAVIFFNFREDSIRQLSEPFLLPGFQKFPVKRFKRLRVVTFTPYAEKFQAPVAFPPDRVEHPLGEVLSKRGKSQLRLAETYKYAHVTYFFNGYREAPYEGEYRVLIPSLNIVHAEERPELRAVAITDRLIEAIQEGGFDFVLANYSNPDTIGHTGNYQACLEAVRVMNRELDRLLEVTLKTSATLLITSDHGNIEEVLKVRTGEMETQHDPNPVPLYLVGREFEGKRFERADNLRNETLGLLADVAPTVLELLGLPKPREMTGRSLLRYLI